MIHREPGVSSLAVPGPGWIQRFSQGVISGSSSSRCFLAKHLRAPLSTDAARLAGCRPGKLCLQRRHPREDFFALISQQPRRKASGLRDGSAGRGGGRAGSYLGPVPRPPQPPRARSPSPRDPGGRRTPGSSPGAAGPPLSPAPSAHTARRGVGTPPAAGRRSQLPRPGCRGDERSLQDELLLYWRFFPLQAGQGVPGAERNARLPRKQRGGGQSPGWAPRVPAPGPRAALRSAPCSAPGRGGGAAPAAPTPPRIYPPRITSAGPRRGPERRRVVGGPPRRAAAAELPVPCPCPRVAVPRQPTLPARLPAASPAPARK